MQKLLVRLMVILVFVMMGQITQLMEIVHMAITRIQEQHGDNQPMEILIMDIRIVVVAAQTGAIITIIKF